jgi:LysM repeat protein/lipoprotein-anchoring transpeptidase ErfK/SrfK
MIFNKRGAWAMLLIVSGWEPAGAASPPSFTGREPGLERAVNWKWQVMPSDDRLWGLDLPAAAVRLRSEAVAPGQPETDPARPMDYEVQRGDALARIGKRFDVPVDLLKSINGLTSDLIRVGQVLRIPTREEVAAARPPAPVASEAVEKKPAGNEKLEEALTVQVFLDREGYSVGGIDGQLGATMQRVVALYTSDRPELAEPAALTVAAREAVPEPLTRYELKREDFRFIATPRAELVESDAATPSPKKKGGGKEPIVVAQAKPTYEELTRGTLLAYRTPWEFVAERYRCNEGYLRSLNPKIELIPAVGTEFIVPNVEPFEIESAFREPMQPRAEAEGAVEAAVLDRWLLEIRRDGKRVAVMPVSIARPGLVGRSEWTILEAIPRPQLQTIREPTRVASKETRIYGRESPDAAPQSTPTTLAAPEVLAAGPNNPVGIFWLNLAIGADREPIPYGLHGTSIPDHLREQESLGGLRLTNWDIARAVRLLPMGTPLRWTAGGGAR